MQSIDWIKLELILKNTNYYEIRKNWSMYLVW